jgi:signal transduction histidine kinase
LDIKLKNKYIQLIALALSLFLLSLSLLAGIDFWFNRHTIRTRQYFDSDSFKKELGSSFKNIYTLYTTYENYESKPDDAKINQEELKNMKENYDSQVKERISQTEYIYRAEIDQAESNKNNDRAKRLVEERDKKIDEIKKADTKTIDDIKKELVTRNNKDYENIKKAVQSTTTIMYYMWNSNKEVFTNIKNITDVNNYISSKSSYNIYFPEATDRNNNIMYINNFFLSKNMKGYIIIPKESEAYSYFQGNYKYYSSLRIRAIAELIISLISLAAVALLLKHLKKNSIESLAYIEKFKTLCLKIPIDARLVLLIFYTFFMLDVGNTGGRIIGWPSSQQIMPHLFAIIYILFAYICAPDIKALINDRSNLREYWNTSLTFKLQNMLEKSIKNKGLFFRIAIFILIACTGGTAIIITVLASSSGSEGGILLFLAIYCLFILIFIIFKAIHLDEIIKATNEIAAGNLNYTLKDKGNGILSKMAHNINNLQVGVKMAVESQMKSDRLKSELITNVSHDLKTPLTSIINYVDLLKREELTKEEMQDYIGVLDRKTQRLKVLIEDLFEASKMATGAVELNIEKVDVAQLLTQSLAEFDEKIKTSSLIFKVTIPCQKIYANLDGKKTWRVFENLIGNAIKYSQPSTRVYIELTENENNILITIKNISTYEMDFNVDEIFERFKRGDVSRATEGSGLGLAIAKSIVDLQGGKLTIEIDGDLFKAIVEFKK